MSILLTNKYNGTDQLPCSKTELGGRIDWARIPTKRNDLLAQGEIRQLVKENALKYKNAVSEQEKDHLLNERHRLFTQYVSHVSPDRKALLKNALHTIVKKNGMSSSQAARDVNSHKTLLDFLSRLDGEGKCRGMINDVPYSFSGGTVTARMTTVGPPVFEIAQGGHVIMFIESDRSITCVPTPSETAMQKEISDFWLSILHGVSSPNKTTVNSQTVESGHFDFRA